MTTATLEPTHIELPLDEPIWDRFFAVHPLVLVATLEAGGRHDIAPKHMATPMSWDNWYGFVCSPRHHTYQNAVRTQVFTVSYPGPDMALGTALSAGPRGPDDVKGCLCALPVERARAVDGVVVCGCPVQLECEVAQIVDELGPNSLIIGRVLAARVHPRWLRSSDQDDSDLIHGEPLLAYLHPWRFAAVDRSIGFPLPDGFKR